MTQSVDTLDDYLTKLASAHPVPGGGSAALVVGAAGCSLLAMVARICAGSKKYEPVHALAQRVTVQADDLRARMMHLKARDEAAFEGVVEARGDKDAMQRALTEAAAAPLEGARSAAAALELASQALQLNNAHLISDVGCAAEFAHAALIACAYNVRINHKFMKDESTIEPQRSQLQRLEDDALSLLTHVRASVNAAFAP